ncbi:MAG: DUF4338 domain-containing protein [Verrucomicrobiales bacterium]|nr:DUF4338 domain-containing protein [Verrucomicrobiales bacterium]MCP5524876.1 DUF4338 domain-containing protein [Verrucomicrobiales bacterium]
MGPGDLTQVKDLLARHPDWSRYRLSRELAQLWAWRSAAGQLKDMAARSLLLKLEQRGWITLPPCRWASPNRMRHKRPPSLPASFHPEPLPGPLSALRPLKLSEVSAGPATERALFEGLLHRYHYLSHRSPVGENLQYLVRERAGRPVACLLFGAAAWQCADRDRHIGWDRATRAAQLPLIANNTRFLILPWIGVPGLASHLLARVSRRVRADWQRKYGHPVYLLETFVETGRFAGTCYRAANWQRVGQTKGRSRQDSPEGGALQVPRKDVYLYPLIPRYAERLRAVPNPTHP